MGLKSNIAYNSFLTVSLYIFQFITYPYAARVLGVENIGLCNFVQNIVSYFILFSSLGVGILGVREISRCKGDREKLDKAFSGIFQMHAAFTLLSLAVYLPAVFIVPELLEYKRLLLIGAAQIIFNCLSFEWVFKGLEDFRYISLRTFFIRLLYVVSVFVFVRSAEDYWLYYLVMVVSLVAEALINSGRVIRTVRWRFCPWREVFNRYLKQNTTLGAYLLLTGMYTSFNVLYLGIVSNNEQVGLYTTAIKLQAAILALYSAATAVMMPRISCLLAQGMQDEARRAIQKSADWLWLFSIPLVILCEFFAEEMIFLLAGEGYSGAVPLFRLSIPLVLIIGLEQIVIVQVLTPKAHDRAILVNSLVGAVMAIALNVALVGKFQGLGSVIVWCACEATVLCSALCFAHRELPLRAFGKSFIVKLLAFVPLMPLLGACNCLPGVFARLAGGVLLTALYGHIIMYGVMKDPVYRALFRRYVKPD